MKNFHIHLHEWKTVFKLQEKYIQISAAEKQDMFIPFTEIAVCTEDKFHYTEIQTDAML